MAVERTYTIPLRKEWLKSVKYKRAKKAVRAINEFIARHMKVEMENIRIGKYLNLVVWSHGINCPPSKVKVNVTKDDKGIVHAEVVGAPVEMSKTAKVSEHAQEPRTVLDKKPEAPKKAENKTEAKAEEKKPAAEKKAEPATKPAEAKPAAPKPAVLKSPSPAPKQQTGQIIR